MEKVNGETDETLYLTVQEAAETLLMSQSAVYAWIDKGRFEAENLPSGKVIVISCKEVEKIRNINLKSRRNRVSKQTAHTNEKIVEIPVGDSNLQENPEPHAYSAETFIPSGNNENYNNLQDSLELAKLISELSSKAGKYELLSDLQKESKEDTEYWKNEFFRLQSENNELRAENLLLKKQLENTRKGFLGLFSRRV